jgi:ABC-type Mn2+/Zn2+ transport system permease subunit
MTWLLAPFDADFMVRAALALLLLGIAAPLCGCWVLQRRLVYLSDAMSHAVLAGVAGSALVGASLLAGAFVAAVVMALVVAALVLRAGVAEDAAIGVAGQTLFALGLVGVALAPGETRALSHILFGNPLTVTWADVRLQAAVTVVVVTASVVLLPVLVATTFDAVHARTVGVRVNRVDTLLVVGLGLVVVLGLTTVGVLLAVSMLVLPAVTARLLTRTLRALLLTAVGLGVTAGLVGLLVSYHLGLPTGPVVVLVAAAQVGVAVLRTGVGRRQRLSPVRRVTA